MAEVIQDFSEQVVKRFQPLHILDDADHAEVEFVNALGKGSREPAFIVFDGKMHGLLHLKQLSDFRVGKQCPQLLHIIALDDESLVKFWITDFNISKSQELADITEESFSINRELEAVLIDVGSPNACVG